MGPTPRVGTYSTRVGPMWLGPPEPVGPTWPCRTDFKFSELFKLIRFVQYGGITRKIQTNKIKFQLINNKKKNALNKFQKFTDASIRPFSFRFVLYRIPRIAKNES